MPIDFINYKTLFHARNESQAAYGEWMETSMDVLSAYAKKASGDHRKAAEALAADWDAESLSYLSYAGFCFWHEPIKELSAKTGIQDPHWSAKMAFRSLIDACVPSGKNASRQEAAGENQAKMEETARRLRLAAVACRARLNKDEDFRKFHEALFVDVLRSVVADEGLRAHAKTWPGILDKNGALKSGMFIVTNDRGSLLTKEALRDVLAHDPQTIAERVSGIVVEAARKLRPDVYSDFPDVVPVVRPKAEGSGGYHYQAAAEDRPASASYRFDPERSDVSGTFEMFSITCAVHETYHLLQRHWMLKDVHPATNPFWCEAQTYPEASIPQLYDRPCRTYPYFPQNDPARAGYDAYVARPTENCTYSFCEGIEFVLCSVWDNQVMPGDPFVKSDISELESLARRNKILPAVPPKKDSKKSPTRADDFVIR